MAALVGADAAEEVGVFELADDLLDAALRKAGRIHYLGDRRRWQAAQDVEDFLVTFLGTFLVTLRMAALICLALRLERAQDLVEHEVDEDAGIACGGRLLQRGVVFLLMRPDDVLDRDAVELIAPGTQNRRLPETTRATVAVGERMDELELEVEDAAFDQRRGVRLVQPGEEILHQERHMIPRRRHMGDLPVFPQDAHVASAPLTGLLDQVRGHEAVRLEQVLGQIRIIAFDRLIGVVRAFDLIDFPLRSRHALAGEDRGDLVFRERVAFDGCRAADRADMVDLPQANAFGTLQDDLVAFERRGNVDHELHGLAADRIFRILGH